MQMSFAAHARFDPPLDLMLHGQHNGIPPMLACFDFKPMAKVPEGRDCVVIVGSRNQAVLRGIAKRARRAVVIVCHGDKTFTHDGRPIPDNILRVFTTNRFHPDPRVTGLPLGVKSETLRLLKFARRHRPERSLGDRALLYLNFAIGSEYDLPAQQRSLPHRKEIANRFRGETWVTDRVFEKPAHQEGAMFKYMTDLMRHKFVVSPEGFGIDCHRHWESLYMSAIPIVQRSKHMQSFSNLPILFTDDYSEINESYLNDVYEDFSARTFDFSKLYAPFYTNLLLQEVNRLKNPAFLLLLSDERSSKERAEGKVGLWPAQRFLNCLSRCKSPYPEDPRTGNVIPYGTQHWRAINGARIHADVNDNLIVEHAACSNHLGALLELPTVPQVPYRVTGEIRNLESTSFPPQLELLSTQTKGKVTNSAVRAESGEADGVTNVDFSFVSAKAGSTLQFRPGRRAMLSLRIEPEVD